jgi:nicotinamide-nucleotide amidase
MITNKKELQKRITPSKETIKKVKQKIRKEIRKKVKKDKLKALVIGISGGLDSAVVAALCQKKYTGVPLIGISIPMDSTDEHREQAKWVGEKYCDVFEEFIYWQTTGYSNNFKKNENCIDNNKIMNIAFKSLETNDKIAKKAGFEIKEEYKSVLKGNMKARLRMITLYDMARRVDGMVLSTDNLSEYNMGFWTINGDVGDYGPIQNIGKGFELPELAKELNIREDIIFQKPSDGLMVTADNTDEAQLGATYKEIDMIMFVKDNPKEIDKKFRKRFLDKKKSKKIIQRYKSTKFKRIGTINLTRKQIGIK